MRIVFHRSAVGGLPLCLAAALLAGCQSVSLDPAAAPAPATPAAPAATPGPAAAAPAPAASSSPQPAVVAAQPPAAAAAVAQPTRIGEDGTVARFQGAETALPAASVALLQVWAADRSRHGKRWEIKGYSNRSAFANAREVALTRALAVRKLLVDRGVPAAQIKVLYSTEEAREAVTLLPR